MFSLNQVRNVLQQRIGEIENRTIQALQYAGEEFVNKARNIRTYVDDTGNLRSSIGYVILKDGQVIDRNFKVQGDGEDGVKAAWDKIDELAGDFPNGYVLIGVAGMSYAAAVESRGYDVITGSAPNSEDIKDMLGAIKI